MPRVGLSCAHPRSMRRWTRVAGVTALLCSVTSPASALERAWVEVVRDDDSGMELVLRAPELQRRDGRAEVPGFATGGEAGLPRVYENAVLVAVPGAGGARLEIVEEQSRRESGVRPDYVPEPWTRDEALSDDAPRVVRPRTWQGAYPVDAVSAQHVGRVRGRDAVRLRFSPLQYMPDGSALYTRSLRVRLTWADRARVDRTPRVAEALHGGFLNAATASRWSLRFDTQDPRAPLSEGAALALPNERLRIRIPRTGIYQLSYDRLQSAGVPVDLINPKTFQMFTDTWHPAALLADSVPASWQVDYALQELALWVDGEDNLSFDLSDRIVFYALGPYEYLDRVGTSADSLAHAQNPYDRFNYVWLVWDQAQGMRMQPVDAAVVGTPPDLVTTALQRYHYEEDVHFAQADNLWIWQQIRDTRPAFARFDLDLGNAPAPLDGVLRLGISASAVRTSGRHGLIVEFNDVQVGSILWNQPTSQPPNAYFSFPVQFETTNDLQVSIDTAQPNISDETLFVSADVQLERPLTLPGPGVADAGLLRWSHRTAAANEAYEIAGFGITEPIVLDVTDPAHPVRMTRMTRVGSGTTTRWRLRYGLDPGVRVLYVAAPAPVNVPSTDLTLRTLPPLRDPARVVPDMLIVTHPTLRAQAERLAAHRAAHYPDDLGRTPFIEVVDVSALYDHFSGGRADPMAIRNYAKFLYSLGDGQTPPNLRYLMLFGEASHDPRLLVPSSTPTLVPTVHPWHAFRETSGEYAVDDWLTDFDAPPPGTALWALFPLPDVASGRVTPRNEAEAERIVDRFIAYDTSVEYGAWRTRLILAADDENTPDTTGEAVHILDTERLVALTPEEWDITKIYLTEYPAVLGQKPSARSAFIREWSNGCALINYVGHGAERQLADEVLFLASDVPSLSNGNRLPVFMAFSCTVSKFDDPELQCMAEDMLTHPLGGAIATMGATTPTFSSSNARYNAEIWAQMFHDGAVSKMPFGVIHALGKTNVNSRLNDSYVLLGDPSMTLLAPEYLVDVSSGSEQLEAGATSTVQGTVHSAGDPDSTIVLSGSADVEVFASADESGYTSVEVPSFHLDYDLLGAPIYRGTVPVTNGRFQFSFVVPMNAHQGNKARVSAYVWDAASGRDAKGAINTVTLVQSANPDSSRALPRISMRFPNNVTKVKPGAPLVAEIVDENGINIQGTTRSSSILLGFDDSGQQLNVTSRFRYDGSDTSGTLTVPLPGLTPGRHKATLVAFDNLQNRGSDSISFDVVAGGAEQLVNVIAFPNPFSDRTHFFFEVTDPADVTVRVFTSSGREVWRGTTFVPNAQQASVRWEGVDSTNDELANGTYLFRVEARPRRSGDAARASGPVLDAVGKVVIMRD